jgi:dienelactone hydrolase
LRPAADWEPLPASRPGVRLPTNYLRFRIEKEGFEALDAAPEPALDKQGFSLEFTLVPQGAGPEGMVRVPGGSLATATGPVPFEEFWIDKHEVTNREFLRFVEAGGYEKPEYWKEALRKDGRALSFAEAMSELRDRTGRPGPATWELGSYPEGQADFPVAGVSWHEAAAYAEYAGKSLPTVHHWRKATQFAVFSEIVMLSNFEGKGPAAVGKHQGLGPYGTYDMAGNVKEWCLNATGDLRYLLGGAWNEPAYQFRNADAQPSLARLETYGFRCARYAKALPDSLTRELQGRPGRDHSKERPASDGLFAVYKGLYTFDRTPLASRIESVHDDSPHWRRERVSFAAAYGGERVPGDLYLPKTGTPPFQTVVYFPGSVAEYVRASQELEQRWFDFVIKSGRAVFLPMYKGTFDRLLDEPAGRGDVFRPSVRRDMVIQWSKDLARSIDYLETRSDVASDKIAFYGFSLGATYAPVLGALEPRLATLVLLAGGLPSSSLPPEIEPVNFAPRVKVPVLMVNGRHDFVNPVETAQVPLFRLLGTPAPRKRHAILEGGHLPPTTHPVIKEILDWLDRQLGPVQAVSKG